MKWTSKMNASSLPEVEDAPPYGELSVFTEPITQKRVMGVTDDYLVLFDYLKGKQSINMIACSK